MNSKKIILVAVLVLFGVCELSAQNFEWALRFDTRFDNHERDALDLPSTGSRTYFSGRLAPVVGMVWGRRGGMRHSFMAGGSYIFDMGAPSDHRPVEPLLYYRLDSPLYGVYAGKFERRHLIGTYSRAIYAGVATFYDNVIEGFAFQLHPGQLKLEAVLDWDGMRSEKVRESFRVLSAAEYNPGKRWFVAGYSLDWYHLASSVGGGEGVVDHISVSPWIGATLAHVVPWFESLTMQVGWLGTFDRDRAGDNKWLTPGGMTVEIGVRKRSFGIRNRLYYGDRQMPLWNEYGNRIYKGDAFYASVRLYNYTQIYWNPRIGRGIDLQLEVGLHSDGKGVGLEQAAMVGISLDNDFFRRK